MQFTHRLRHIRRWAVCLGMITCLFAVCAQAQPKKPLPRPLPMRVLMPDSVDLVGSILIGPGGWPIPIPGLRYTHNFTSRSAITLEWRTFGPYTNAITVGTNWYFSDSNFSAYVYARLGFEIMAIGEQTVYMGLADLGFGYEMFSSGGFKFGVELGPTIAATSEFEFFGKHPGGMGIAGRATITIGYRF